MNLERKNSGKLLQIKNSVRVAVACTHFKLTKSVRLTGGRQSLINMILVLFRMNSQKLCSA